MAIPQQRALPKKLTRLPKARRFAVARMDKLAMVKHLQDPVAVAQVMALPPPKKYLVYLEFPQDLPMPDSEWCRYRVNPVASTLRPPCYEKGLFDDMVLPISPNTQHARCQTPISATPSFLFSNCYFWIESRMSLRVRANYQAGYDNDKAYQLDIPQHVALSDAFQDDYARINQFWKEKQSNPIAFLQSDCSSESSTSMHFTSDMSTEPSSLSFPPLPPLIADMISLNLLGWEYDPSFQFLPLVDLWLELDDHLSPDNIPNPADLWKEQETIGLIIQDSLKRRELELRRRQMEATVEKVISWKIQYDDAVENSDNEHSESGSHSHTSDDDIEMKSDSPEDSPVSDPAAVLLEVMMTHVHANGRPGPAPVPDQYRSWSGNIRHTTQSHAQPVLQNQDHPGTNFGSSPPSEDLPSYPPSLHSRPSTASLTRPPSYASLFSDTRTSSSSQSSGSHKAAVWRPRNSPPTVHATAAPPAPRRNSASPPRKSRAALASVVEETKGTDGWDRVPSRPHSTRSRTDVARGQQGSVTADAFPVSETGTTISGVSTRRSSHYLEPQNKVISRFVRHSGGGRNIAPDNFAWNGGASGELLVESRMRGDSLRGGRGGGGGSTWGSSSRGGSTRRGSARGGSTRGHGSSRRGRGDPPDHLCLMH